MNTVDDLIRKCTYSEDEASCWQIYVMSTYGDTVGSMEGSVVGDRVLLQMKSKYFVVNRDVMTKLIRVLHLDENSR